MSVIVYIIRIVLNCIDEERTTLVINWLLIFCRLKLNTFLLTINFCEVNSGNANKISKLSKRTKMVFIKRSASVLSFSCLLPITAYYSADSLMLHNLLVVRQQRWGLP